MNAEQKRLREIQANGVPWRLWGPYLSERQWGTVREDYSADGDAWNAFTRDQAPSRAYRWGEDGIAGISDEHQRMCLGLALWNGRDPFLKERLFGLTNTEGNHGEDVKELYYFLDATPSHSYLKTLYKYPQAAFPYDRLIEENARRGTSNREFELVDTGIFDEDRYFDVFVEYAKASPTDILLRITAYNRGPDDSELHLLPQLWFRNTWSWAPGLPKPQFAAETQQTVLARHPGLGEYRLHADGAPTLLFCDNETNAQKLFDAPAAPGHFKDAIQDCVIHHRHAAVNALQQGTKVAAHYRLNVGSGQSTSIRLRLTTGTVSDPFEDFDTILGTRLGEADAFYADIQQDMNDADARNVQRQAFAGLIWTKQYYHYSVHRWLEGDPNPPPPPVERLTGRNHAWTHIHTAEVLSMPDSWEFPWFATWDLAFHCIPFALIDAEFAKSQLLLLTREWYMDRDGELPAYEWKFSDTNPPVHAWAAWRVFTIDRKQRGDQGDIGFLERILHKLLINFTWWVNRKDCEGHNLFQGGFLGLDNIGVFDRSEPLPHGGRLDQADATSWMAMYCLNLMRISLELALHNPSYQDLAVKFFEHFLMIAGAINGVGGHGMGLWDDDDQFFYSLLHGSDGSVERIRTRTMVSLIPLFAVETIEPEVWERLPDFEARLEWYLDNRPDLCSLISRWRDPGQGERRLLALLRGHRMKCVLRRMLDETEFLSDYGIRSLSRHHAAHPYALTVNGRAQQLNYEPGESESRLFGGNSNWRGPVWFPVNFLIIEALQKFHYYYGDDFKIECPTHSGQHLTIDEVATEIGRRLTRLFLNDTNQGRPVFGDYTKLRDDPHFRDHILFHEYFHGDTGRGCGASHQTGWTALVAKLLMPRGARTD